MTQTFDKPTASTKRKAAILDKINPALDALRSSFEGAGLPATAVEGQVATPADGLRYVYRGGVWQVLEELVIPVFQGSISATLTRFAWPQWKANVVDVTVLSNVDSTSDGSNRWTLQLTNLDTGLTLFGTAPTTNGDDLAADTPWTNAVTQNATVEAGEVLEVVLTKTGAATTLTNALLAVRVRRRWD